MTDGADEPPRWSDWRPEFVGIAWSAVRWIGGSREVRSERFEHAYQCAALCKWLNSDRRPES